MMPRNVLCSVLCDACGWKMIKSEGSAGMKNLFKIDLWSRLTSGYHAFIFLLNFISKINILIAILYFTLLVFKLRQKLFSQIVKFCQYVNISHVPFLILKQGKQVRWRLLSRYGRFYPGWPFQVFLLDSKMQSTHDSLSRVRSYV